MIAHNLEQIFQLIGKVANEAWATDIHNRYC
jgi:hypothetical protein